MVRYSGTPLPQKLGIKAGHRLILFGAPEGFDATLGYGLLAPAGTPRPIIERLNRELRAVLANDAVLNILRNEGVDTLATTPEEFTAMIDREEPKWSALIKAIGLQPQK